MLSDGGSSLTPQQKTPQRPLLIGLSLAVALIVAVTYYPVLSTRTLWIDDDQYLTDNPLVQKPGWNSIRRFFAEVMNPSTVEGYYHPLAMSSLMMDCWLGGRPDHLRPFHRTALCLHVLNSVLLFSLCYLLFGNPWAAAVAGVLFGIHPMTVEVIPWAGERKTVLASFFALAGLCSYVLYVRGQGPKAYAGTLILYVLALLSKPTTTPLPALMLLLDAWPLRRLNRRAVVEKLPLLAVAAVSSAITVLSHGRTSPLDLPSRNPVLESFYTLTHNLYLYLSRSVWFGQFASPYFYPEPFSIRHPAVLAGVVGSTVLVVLLVLSLRRTPSLVVGVAFFLVTLLPAMSLIRTNPVIASDKYAYLPMVGLFLPVAYLLSALWTPIQEARAPRWGRIASAAVVLLAIGAEAKATRLYLAPWKDKERLLAHLISISPEVPQWHYGLANMLKQRGDLPGAIKHYQVALQRWPTLAGAREGLAEALARQGKTAEALQNILEVIRLEPANPQARYLAGNLLLERGQTLEAIEQYAEAIRLRSDFAEAHNNFGVALLKLGRIDEAIDRFQVALRLRPDLSNARRNLNTAMSRRPGG